MAAIRKCTMIWRGVLPLSTLCGWGLLLTACSSLPISDPTGLITSKQLSARSGDPCTRERADFNDAQSYFGNDLVSKVVMGGMNAMVSTLATRLGSGSTSQLGSGLRSAAFSGAKAGYLSSLANSSADKSQMVQQMGIDLNRENEQTDALHTRFSRLQSCRFQQAHLIKTSVHRGQLSPDEARSKLDEQRQLFDEELAKARQSSDNMGKRDAQFQYAAEELDQPSIVPAAGSGQAKRAVNVASVTLPRKRDSFVTAVSDAEVRSKSDLADDSATS